MLRREEVQVALALAGLTALKLTAAALLDLRSVEAYYWLYGKHPAAGYFDHPGMIGWLVAVSTWAFGDGAFGVRLPAVLCGAGAAWFAFLAARRASAPGVARLASLIVALVPVFALHGAETAPDAPLLFFWSGALWALAHIATGGRPGWWYLAGLFAGAAMDSKYTAVFLPFGVLCWLALSPQRWWLRRREPYVAAAMALACFLPTLWWNATHGWQSLAYQGAGRFMEAGGFKWRYVRDLFVDPFVMLTPVVFAVAAWETARTVGFWEKSTPAHRLLAAAGLPMLAFFAVVALTRSVRGYWTAPAYIGLALLAAMRGGRIARSLLWATVGVLALAYVVMVPVAAGAPRPWAALANAVRARDPDFVLAQDYHEASQLAWHLRPMDACDFTAVGKPSTSFRNWWQGDAMRGRDAVIVWEADAWPRDLELVRGHFDHIGEPETVRVPLWRGDDAFVLVRARGYRP